MTKAPVLKLLLKLLDFIKQVIIQTDASGYGMGAVLIQNGHPISFLSKKFYPKLQNSSNMYENYMQLHRWLKNGHYLLGN